MFHCPVGVLVIEQHAIILSAILHAPPLWSHADDENRNRNAMILILENAFQQCSLPNGRHFFWPSCVKWNHIVTLTMQHILNTLTPLCFEGFKKGPKTFAVLNLLKDVTYLTFTPVACGFPSQRVSNADNVSIWWRHHAHDNSLSPKHRRYPPCVFSNGDLPL